MAAEHAGWRYIGKPFPVREDRRFVRGRGRYIGDIALPGMLHMAVAPSPLAHARLHSVDTGAALELDGVVAVITGADLAAATEPLPQNLVLPDVAWYPLAVDKVRFAGEWIAAVVATSRAVAEDAAELVAFELDELPAVVDPLTATEPGTPVLHEAHGSNVAWRDTFEWGDVDGAFATAAHVFEYRYRWNRSGGVPLETFGAIAHVDRATDELRIWASHQQPGLDHELAHVLRRRSSSVRLHADVDVGGSYGAKRGNKQIAMVAYAATVCDAPVRFVEDRVENLVAGDGHGPDRLFTARFAVDGDGTVQAFDLDILDDVGAYVGRGALQQTKPITAVVGPYTIGAVRYGGTSVMTNKTNQAPFRGFGQGPHNYVLERSLDRIARVLEIDRVELRRRNLIPADAFPYRIPSGSTYDSGDYQAALELALAMPENPLVRRPEPPPGKLVGVGLATCIEPSGGNQAIFSYMNPSTVAMTPETVRLVMDRSGDVTALIGFQSTGQSHESYVTQVLCEELGIVPDRVAVQRGDSLSGVVGATPIGDRMTLMLGLALVQAGRRLLGKLTRIAAHNLGCEVAEVDYEPGVFRARGDAARSLTLEEVARIAYTAQARLPDDEEPGLVVTAIAKLPGGGLGLDEHKRLRQGFPSYGFSVHVCSVEIDTQTLLVALRDYLVVHDCGTVINPLVVDGMVYGGIAHAVGGLLLEQFAYSEDGQPLSASFMDYLLPTVDVVPHVRVESRSTPSPLHPYGAKGTGEGGYLAAPAAIASAIDDALAPWGVEVDATPITPQRIFAALPDGWAPGEARRP